MAFTSSFPYVCGNTMIANQRTSDYTTQEYFDRKKESLFGNAHAHIATSCMTYLSFNAFADASSWISVDDHLQRTRDLCHHPLAHYAASNWAEHAREVTDANVSDAVLSFLSQTNNVMRAVRLDFQLRGDFDASTENFFLAESFSTLHMAAIYGLKHIMERLIDEGAPADSRDCRGQTPLMFATMCGRLSVVEMLAERDDVDINAQTYPPESLTSLILAAKYVRPHAVRILLEGGADANICSNGCTALSWAVSKRIMKSIELLLEAGADPDTLDEAKLLADIRQTLNEELLRRPIT